MMKFNKNEVNRSRFEKECGYKLFAVAFDGITIPAGITHIHYLVKESYSRYISRETLLKYIAIDFPGCRARVQSTNNVYYIEVYNTNDWCVRLRVLEAGLNIRLTGEVLINGCFAARMLHESTIVDRFL